MLFLNIIFLTSAMKQQEVFKKIGDIIKELNDQYAYLEKEPDQLIDLELELFVANAHFLTDHAEILRKLSIHNRQTALPPTAHIPPATTELKQPVEKYFEPLVQKATPTEAAVKNEAIPTDKQVMPPKTEVDTFGSGIDLSLGTATDNYSYTRDDEPETIRHELVLDEAEDWEEDEPGEYINEELIEPEIIKAPQRVEEIPEPVKAVIPEPIAPPIKPVVSEPAEPLKPVVKEEEPVLTINQKISAQLKEAGHGNIAAPATGSTITDLKSAITLNDKMLYVTDLFNGYTLAYNEVIEILNRYKSFAEADAFLKANYEAKNNWASKQITVSKFYALLKRRYA
jgi:chromatin segregation and condensation protein Rec8/ScpA/Scc1 (kleisin family)